MADFCAIARSAPSFAAAERAMRALLLSFPMNASLPPTIVALLQYHARWREKTRGQAVVAVRKVPAAVSGSFALQLLLADGSLESIDWRKAVEGLRGSSCEKGSKRANVRQAFREAVRDQVVAARFAMGGAHGDGREVDHVGEDFAKILRDFLRSESLELDAVAVCKRDSPRSACLRIEDSELEARWQAWHHERARYQLVTCAEHRELTKQRAKNV